MSLPVRTIVPDIGAVCSYLATKPTGATFAEAKAVVNKKHLDPRKLTALKFWGLIEEDGNKIRITEQGRLAVKNDGAQQSEVLLNVLRQIPPYAAVIEKAVHQHEETTTATEVAAHWHDNFKDQVSQSDNTLNAQAVCFFHIAEGADLGSLTIGRKGKPTRFDFAPEAIRAFVNSPASDMQNTSPVEHLTKTNDSAEIENIDHEQRETSNTEKQNNRIFITHGKNKKILKQVKELLVYGKFEPVVSIEHETTAQPIPQKIMNDMRDCVAAVIHVSSEQDLKDEDGNKIPQINNNVLIEIGAAMALYGDKFILLVQDGVDLPSNLQGIYECRYQGNELNMDAIMKLLKAFSNF